MAKDIFISYSSKEFDKANKVRIFLENSGISCWMAPMSIPGGSNYAREIPYAIRNCKVFVLILSEKAQQSKWIPAEIESAINHGKVIIPFKIDHCAINDEFSFMLSRSQIIEAYNIKADALERLVHLIDNFVSYNQLRTVTISMDKGDTSAVNTVGKTDFSAKSVSSLKSKLVKKPDFIKKTEFLKKLAFFKKPNIVIKPNFSIVVGLMLAVAVILLIVIGVVLVCSIPVGPGSIFFNPPTPYPVPYPPVPPPPSVYPN